jgi:hypothetical protein
MSTSQCAPDPGLGDAHAELVESAPPGASKLLKILLIGFAATMTIGLGLASWYVGVRIKAAGAAVSVSMLNTVSRSGTVVEPAATARELYLEVAGLRETTTSF